MHTHALVCLHTSRRAPCTKGTLQWVCTLSHSSKHTRTCVCSWAACTYPCLQPRPLQALSATLVLVRTICHAQSNLH